MILFDLSLLLLFVVVIVFFIIIATMTTIVVVVFFYGDIVYKTTPALGTPVCVELRWRHYTVEATPGDLWLCPDATTLSMIFLFLRIW